MLGNIFWWIFGVGAAVLVLPKPEVWQATLLSEYIFAHEGITGDTLDTLRRYQAERFPRFRPQDRWADPFTYRRSRSLFDLQPSGLRTNILLDSSLRYFYIDEQLGSLPFRPPTLLPYDVLYQIESQRAEEEYWRREGGGVSEESATRVSRGFRPQIPVTNRLFGRIFGGDYIEFRPIGFVNLDFAYRSQRVANPAVPAARQRVGTFDFQPQANLNLTGQVGEKLRIITNFNTQASFDFENNFRVEYTGYPEEIIRKIEFGNVNFNLPTSLIQGSQSLFGAKAELQFGKLRVQGIFSQKRSVADQITLQGGAQLRNFELRASDYEENRHFFLSQFHRRIYEPSLRTLPMINSGVLITRVEVYVTNRTNNATGLRNIVAFLDLGEGSPFREGHPLVGGANPQAPANNAANQLFANLIANTALRNIEQVVSQLQAQGFENGSDFAVLRSARRLEPTEYSFHPQLGYLTLNTPLRNDELLAVAFEYTFNGQVYRVGELSDDYLNRPESEAIFLKMLRPPAIRTDLPSWDLMMKNIYSLNATQIRQDNFQLRIIYRDDLTGLDNPALHEGIQTRNVPLLRLFGLDELNPRGDRQIDAQGNSIGDGNFDFVEGITINTAQGLIIFPKLEPFGSHLRRFFDPLLEAELIDKYVFEELYRGTQNDAENNFANKNKFFIVGRYEGAAGSSVFLPGINVAQGSVIVRAGGIQLNEGTDYIVNYSTGQVTIINEAILASGKEVTIEYEKADFFNLQTRTYMGARFDYALDRDVNIGATLINLRERPILTRVAMGSEAINNTMLGADIALRKESRLLTRLTDALPLIQTKEKSVITFQAEVAQLRPGAARLSGAVSYIDDFEGTRIIFDLGRTANLRWKLGATPPQLVDNTSSDPLRANYRRALLAWYNVDNTFYRTGPGIAGRPDNITPADLENHYMRPIIPQEIFPNRQFQNIVTNENTFDLAFFPSERGPYNYNPNLTADGRLPNPAQNFGAITHAIMNQVDFDNANVEYVEFWLLDPFIPGERGRVIVEGPNGVNNTTGGELYINLGTISEDVIPDGRHFFENGLPTTPQGNKDQTPWGYVPNQPFLINAFSNEPGARPLQDVGLDGVANDEESVFFQDYLNSLPPAARSAIEADPSGDNFRFYLDNFWDGRNAKIIERYKYYNNTEGNSPENAGAGLITPAGTNLPDNEDLNQDNTLNDIDAYYEYRISLRPQDMVVGRNYIVDKVVVSDPSITKGDPVTWYQFRIPIREPDAQVGNIEGFKSIRYMRLYLTGFTQPVVLRMAQFQLVSNQWRRFLGDMSAPGFQLPPEPYDPSFVISTVNLEENAALNNESIPYDIPPGAVRDIDVTSINNRELNEQSMQLCVEELKNGDARAAFKNVNLNLLFYKRLRMYIHAHDLSGITQDDEISAIIRLGTDFTQNYYEIEVPLKLTTLQEVYSAPNRRARQEAIWKLENELDIALDELVATKVARNNERGFRNGVFVPYTRQVGRYRITVVGNPDLSAILVLMLGIRNPDLPGDNGAVKSACVWFNELRTDGYEQTAGVAATSRLNVQLADFANITASGRLETFGFGGLNQRIYQRSLNNTRALDLQATFALDKFMPSKWGVRLPLFVSYQRTNVAPEFDPLDPDVRLRQSLEKFEDEFREEYRRMVETNETRRSINLTNVRKLRTNPDAKPKPWSISNFAYTWAYSEIERSDMTVAAYQQQRWRNALNYTYSLQPKPWEPFRQIKWLQSPWLGLIRDFNLIMQPTSISLRGELDRTFIRTQFRDAGFSTFQFAPFFEKYYTFTRFYDVQFAISKNISLNYNADALAVIDEPAGEINTQANRDSVWANLRRLGRMQDFRQRVSINYKLPLDRFPLTDWLSADAAYTTNYQWKAATLGFEDSVGNAIRNNRDQSLRLRADMLKLYNKVKILNEINQPPRRPPPNTQVQKDTSRRAGRELLKAVLRPLMMVRNLNLNYAKQEGTTLPGFRPRPRYLGMDAEWQAPGWEFILGSQNPAIRRMAADNGWLIRNEDTTGILLNQPFQQMAMENLTLQANLEPFREFRIQLDAKRSRGIGYNEIFRYDPALEQFRSLSPVRTGSYSVSTILLNTSFIRSDKTLISSTFDSFVANRSVIQQRLQNLNPNAGAYDLNGQDVLVPAFLAAYGGRSAEDISLSAFQAIPLPNWRLTYNGLGQLSFFRQWFNNISITHSYTAEYQINNYTSSLRYQDESLVGIQVLEYNYLIPSALNDEGFFVPVYILNGVRLLERFNPLIGVTLRTNSNLNLRVDYNRGREMVLNLSNTQVTESHNEDFIVGFGYTTRNLVLPFRNSDRERIVLRNETVFRMDFALRDIRTIQRRIGEEHVFTAGNQNFQLRPNITYNVDQRLTLQVYFERIINVPRVSNAFVRKDTGFGFQLRYNFTQ